MSALAREGSRLRPCRVSIRVIRSADGHRWPQIGLRSRHLTMGEAHRTGRTQGSARAAFASRSAARQERRPPGHVRGRDEMIRVPVKSYCAVAALPISTLS